MYWVTEIHFRPKHIFVNYRAPNADRVAYIFGDYRAANAGLAFAQQLTTLTCISISCNVEYFIL